jgi:hypothetical protein
LPIAFSPLGATVSDEVAVFATANTTTVGGSAFYYSTVDQMADHRVVGCVNGSVGVYTGAGLSGTRYEVIFEGTPAAGQILWDVQRALLYSVSTHTSGLYCTYRGYGEYQSPVEHHAAHFAGEMVSGSTQDWMRLTVDDALTFDQGSLTVDGNLPSALVTAAWFTSSNGGGTSVTFTHAGSASRSGLKSLSADLVLAAGSSLWFRCDGKGASAVTARLYRQSVMVV